MGVVGLSVMMVNGERVIQAGASLPGLVQLTMTGQLIAPGQACVTSLAALGVSAHVICMAQVSLLGVGMLAAAGDTAPHVTGIIGLTLRPRSFALSLKTCLLALSLRARSFDLTLHRR